MGIPVNVCFRNSKQPSEYVAKVKYRSIAQVFNLLMKDQKYSCCVLDYKNLENDELTIGAIRTLQEKLKNVKRIRVRYEEGNYGYIKGKYIDSIDISYAHS